MNDTKYAPVCGIYCGNCGFLGEQCEGCGYVNGKTFWTAHIPSGICPIYDCCNNQKQIKHCGMCGAFPCKIFMELRDPNMSDEEFQKSLTARQEALKRRKEIGTENWLLEVSSS